MSSGPASLGLWPLGPQVEPQLQLLGAHLQPVFIQRHSGGLGQKRGLRLCAFCFHRGCGACIGWGHPRAYKGDAGWEQSPSPVGAVLPSCVAVGGRGRASRGLIVCACGGYI